MLKRLYIKFVLINMMIVTAMLCIILGTVLSFTHRNLEEKSLDMMRNVAMAPMRHNRPGEMPQDVRLPFFVLELGEDGTIVAARGGYYDLSDQGYLQELVSKAEADGRNVGMLKQYDLRYMKMETPMGRQLIFADVSSELNAMRTLVKNCILIGVGSFLVFLVLILLLARWAIRPVEKAWQQQRQFVADASHELKTPLTVILTNAELLQSPEYDQDAHAQFSRSILAMSRQMRGLVENLLDLARLDAGVVREGVQRLDLSKLVSDAVLPFEAVYFERGLALTTQVEEGLALRGEGQRLRQVVEILLDNAQKYTQPGGQVALSLVRQRNRAVLTVSNPGEPIPPQECKDIFKRFYRGDKARSMNGSYGLGLAIARDIVMQHRGKIWAESREGTNFFFVSLPL